MGNYKYVEEYCTGCGLCHSVYGTELELSEKGFPVCKLGKNVDIEIYEKLCPVFYYKQKNSDGIWGKIDKAVVGYASDEKVRFRAASGGALTEIATYLLEKRIVNGIIHVAFDEKHPTTNITCVSRTAKEIRDRCGSRYSISVPLENILQLIQPHEKYAFIGKPCDVMALRRYMNLHDEMKEVFPYLLTFFCAGEPSVCAQEKLLEAMSSSLTECKNITL